ncbi:MAG: transporter, MMPL family [uncultured Corynebacteriales bacterium]|uniref:Transporter, MMPL family n=1 Tax=uncultured Mycobacteriales bacterium TaxID=581187 RepID=A0A6J4J000_9ACTN|nr:MAG: transporter, MMPL family [uncultured Corynebacteriales bacterium]
MPAVTVAAASRRSAWIVLALAVLSVVGVFLLPTPEPAAPESSTGLPSSYQSVRVEQLRAGLPGSDVQPAVVVYSRTDGGPLSAAELATLRDRGPALARLAEGGQVPPPEVGPDRTVAIVAVPLSTAGEDTGIADRVAALREAAAADLPAGVRVQVTGGPAFTADLTAVFDGADNRLLLVTVAVVALLLLVTYRSPVLWLVPLIVVAATEQVTLRLVDLVLPVFGLAADGSTTGIVSVLVFGATTDYALLLIARYREELRGREDRYDAMRHALRRTAEAILASGFTVVLAVLTLLLATVELNRSLAVGAAVGILAAMASGLLVLPAALVLLGRGLFWPLVPRVGSTGGEGRLWGRLGSAVARRPLLVGLGATAALLALAAAGLTARTGLSQTEQFRVKPEAVLGAQTLATSFPAGSTQPTVVTTAPAAQAEVVRAASTVPGVVSAVPGARGADVAEVRVVLSPEPGTAESDRAVRGLREAVAGVPGADAAVGGPVAATLDVKDAYARDVRVILPLILLLVAVVLVLLLRSLVAPLLLVLTVVLSFGAAFGAGWLIFTGPLGVPALDSSVLLLSFLFLIALGVDYNIFLVTRAREDAGRLGTAGGMLAALRVTGGVITSAGILLAAVFAVLGVLPLITLTQIGVIVCVGVLLDTLLVRTVLVPSLVFLLGDRFWWPGRPHRAAPEPVAEPAPAGAA